MDGSDAVLINKPGSDPEHTQEGMAMKKINLDGVEYEGEEKLIEFYLTQKKRADSAEAELEKLKTDSEESKKALTKLEAERDALKDRADKAEKELKEARTPQSILSKSTNWSTQSRAFRCGRPCRSRGQGRNDRSRDQEGCHHRCVPFSKAGRQGRGVYPGRFDAALEELETRADGDARVWAEELPSAASRKILRLPTAGW
jgi:hypothetical protein